MSRGSYLFRIKRFDPERDRAPRFEEFRVELGPSDRLLDGLIRIKDELDGTLTFRRSCAHGICGSCAVKVNGMNRLACQSLARDLPAEVTIEPLPALPVIKDLVVDMDRFFAQNDKVIPYLVNPETPPARERLQRPEQQAEILQSITCIMCACCTTSCPGFWNDMDYIGPSAFLKAYRFALDSRDRAAVQRIRRVAVHHGLWRCHSVYNCVEVCPKGIDVTAHIARLKRMALRLALLGGPWPHGQDAPPGGVRP